MDSEGVLFTNFLSSQPVGNNQDQELSSYASLNNRKKNSKGMAPCNS